MRTVIRKLTPLSMQRLGVVPETSFLAYKEFEEQRWAVAL